MSLLLLFTNRSSATPSGGWRRASPRPGHWPREEPGLQGRRAFAEVQDETESERAAPPPQAHSEPAAAALLGGPTPAEATELRRLARLSAQADAIAEAGKAMDLAGLRTAGYLDAEIERYLQNIEDQSRRLRRLREEEWIVFFE